MLGTCKLCLEEKRLLKSHFLPAFLYRLCREPSAGANPNPVVVTRKIAVATSEQMKTFLLCRDCERRFHERGEGWVAQQVYNGKHFPLLDRLTDAPQIAAIETPPLAIFNGDAVGIDTGKLAYFALSVLWRASVHKWKMVDGGTTSIDLVEYQEPIKTFLLGGAFPSDVVVVTTVCTDEFSQGSVSVPQTRPGPRPVYSFFARGVAFTIFTGGDMRQFCCLTSVEKPILVTSREVQTISALASLSATAKPSRGFALH